MTEARIEELSRRDNEIVERLDRAEVRFDRFESRVEQRFTEIDKRLTDIDHRIADVHKSIADVHKAIAVQTRWFLVAAAAIAVLYPLVGRLGRGWVCETGIAASGRYGLVFYRVRRYTVVYHAQWRSIHESK